MTPSTASGAGPLRADARRNRARILAAAEAVFAEKGAGASTEEVASRAGVAIGTVFRHFPTKRDLLAAIFKELMARLTDEANALVVGGDPADALFAFFARVVEQAAARKTVADALAGMGVEIQVVEALRALHDAIGTLLTRAQRAGAVRPEVRLDEVIALLSGACQGALRAGWDADLRRRTLAIVFAGLRADQARAAVRPAAG
jgi:AcrR family transcriptional regulator